MIRRLLWMLLCSCLQTAHAQPQTSYIFRHLDHNDGLLHNMVFSIAQDADGYMWIGTNGGMQRYDGIRFTNFQKGISTLSSQAAPTNIYTGNKDNVWFICVELMKLDKVRNQIQVFNADSLRFDRKFTFTEYKDEKNSSWFLGDFGLYIADTTKQNQHIASPQVPNSISQNSNAVIRSRSAGETWAIGGLNLLFDERRKKIYSPRYNPFNHPFLSFLQQTSLHHGMSLLLIDRDGNYWLATWGGRLVFFETWTGRSTFFSIPEIAKQHGLSKGGKGTMNATCLFEDSRGSIWAGTNYAGLLRLDKDKGLFSPVPAKDTRGYGLDYNFNVHCITEDREGNLWLGTDKGINIFHPYRQYFHTISAQKGDKNSLPDAEITSTLGLRNGDVIVTTWGGGFCLYDSLFRRKAMVQPPGPYQYTMTWDAVEAKDGTVWIGAQHGFLYRYQPQKNTWEITRPPEAMNSTIRCLIADDDGNIYLGLNNGHIIKWDVRRNAFVAAPNSKKERPVLNLLFHNQQLLAATESGLLLIDAETMQSAGRFFPANEEYPRGIKTVYGLAVVNDSILLVGTRNAGLFSFNIRTKTFFQEPAFKLIQHQSVYALQIAADGSIWFTTDYAIYRFVTSDKKLLKFTPEKGQINMAFSQCNFRPMASGKWLTSTYKEVVTFNPASWQSVESKQATVLVTGIKVLEKNLPVDSLVRQNNHIRLNHNQNFIRFYFSDMRYNGITDRVFYHRLGKVNTDWVQSGTEGMATYTELAPGEYVFEVKCDNAANAPVTKWFITITPPVYATWWFRSVLLLLISGSITLAIRRRVAGIRQQSELKQRIAEAEVSALRAQMNPHFIFNCLSAIDNMIETDQKEKATTYLNRFARLIRSVLESSKQTLVPLYSDVETLSLYLELEQFRCDNRFTYNLTADPQLLQGDYKVPPLVVQPFVENAIHHGLLNRENRGGCVQVSITARDNCIVYRIEDNGVGRQAAAELKHPAEERHTSYGIVITEDRIRLFNKGEIDQPVLFTDLYKGGKPVGTLVEVFLRTD